MTDNDSGDRSSGPSRPAAYWRSMGMEDTAPLELFVSILRAHQMLWNEAENELKTLDLGVTRLLALATIMENDAGCRLSDLSAAILVHPTTVTMIVTQLVAQGLVRRVPHATDRRSTLAVITPAGRALTREAFRTLEGNGLGIADVSRTKMHRALELLAEIRAELGDTWPRQWAGS